MSDRFILICMESLALSFATPDLFTRTILMSKLPFYMPQSCQNPNSKPFFLFLFGKFSSPDNGKIAREEKSTVKTGTMNASF